MFPSYDKDPAANLDYGFNLANWLVGGDTVAVSSWIVPAGLTAGVVGFSPTATLIWLSGGTAGMWYEVTNHFRTVAGREDERTMIIKVRER
jgi:hypothetical protein